MKSTKRRQASKKQRPDLRALLIESGMAMIAEHGVGALTLRAAGAAAGVSRQAPYHHFGDKAGLLEAIAVAGFAQLTEALKAAASAPTPPKERLVAIGLLYVQLATAQPRLFELLSGAFFAAPEDHPKLAAARDEAYAVLDEVMVEYLESCGKASLRHVAGGSAWALAHGLARLLIEGGLRPDEFGVAEDEFVKAALRTLTDGIGA